MKQYITVEQLKELDLRAFSKLYKLVRVITNASLKQIHNIYSSMKSEKGFSANTLVREITIGMMIEILGDGYYPNIGKDSDKLTCEWWQVDLFETSFSDEAFNKIKTFHSAELIDALWEAVKYSLTL